MGRLGNQMFQFASTLGIAKRLGYDARFPIENCSTYQGSGPFDPSTGRPMPVKCDLADCFSIGPEYFIPGRRLIRGLVYSEQDFGYNKQTENIPDNCQLNGYFQTEKYFCDFRELILSQFDFRSSIKEAAEFYIKKIRKENPNSSIVSMHVRRGDYVMYPDHHPPCSLNYYNNAVNELRSSIDNLVYLVFSDDVNWCKSVFTDPSYIISDLGDPYIELCTMSLCDHNVMANSSFSWWGSWLNTNPDKIVIAPSRWFGSQINHDVSDVYFKNVKIVS